MQRLLRWSGTVVVVLLLGFAATLLWGPVEQVDLSQRFDETTIGSDIDLWLVEREGAFTGIEPSTEKKVIWAGAKGQKTPTAVLYLHGFSGSSVDIKPVPDLVAEALGAKLFYTRFTGHGQDGVALGAASSEDWITDTAEALAIGQRLGDQVLCPSSNKVGHVSV